MRKAVLLINIGSPDAWNVSAVRKYLKTFLMDKRVIDIPFLFRWLLVNLIIAPFRAPKSLKSYQKILIDEQSPLIYYSFELEKALQNKLGKNYVVKTAMMYGKPYLKDVLKELKRLHLSEILVIPLYPQYASSTTGSSLEMVFNEIKNWQVIPNVITKHTFFNHPEFIDLWANHIQAHLPETYDYVLFSYHGLPERQIFKADNQFDDACCNLNECCFQSSENNFFCYRKNCLQTTELISSKLNLDKNKVLTCFQSRLGQSEWLKPYAIDKVTELAKSGVKNLVVVSPAFVIDCLETLFEIQVEYAEVFQQHGGEKLVLIPSLNAKSEWVDFLYKRITK